MLVFLNFEMLSSILFVFIFYFETLDYVYILMIFVTL
jgi:hypothetical protein